MTPAASFDLTEAVKSITEHHFQRVVCQFPDEYLDCCTEVYLQLTEQVPPECDIFIAADSTFGSSVDDISAAHVDADLLIFFGSDLSGSGSVDVMIIPPMKTIDVQKCADALVEKLKELDSKAIISSAQEVGDTTIASSIDTPPPPPMPTPAPVLLIMDPCYLHAWDNLAAALGRHFPHGVLQRGRLPECLGLSGHWAPRMKTPVLSKVGQGVGTEASSETPTELVGGVHFAVRDIVKANNVLYVGEKDEQLASLFLRLSQQRVLQYSPQQAQDLALEEDAAAKGGGREVEVFQGDTTRVFRERFGGVSRVKAAKLVGLLVGSMGIETGVLQTMVRQLQTLITAAGKKFYVFVLGRINEAKLCNFPEIDLFCLISNDDNALIPPKTFHAPVITPYELELGLGARAWSSMYLTSCTSSYTFPADTTTTTETTETRSLKEGVEDEEGVGLMESFATRLQRVQEAKANQSGGSDSDSDSSDEGVDEAYAQYKQTFQQPAGEAMSQALALLTVHEHDGDDMESNSNKNSNKLIAFESPAAEYLATREFQGLVATTEEGASTQIAQGQFGIAAGYHQLDTQVENK